MYVVRKLKLGKSSLLDELTQASGELYTQVLVYFWRVVRKKGIWLSSAALMRLFGSERLHSQSAQATVQSFYSSLKSWRKRRKIDPHAKPPHRRRKYFKVIWKSSAIRLKDGEGLQQEECARLMGVSRPTFHRVLSSARGKVAEALTQGKAIRIEGGNFAMPRQRLRCGRDGHEWEIAFEEMQRAEAWRCPRCRHSDVSPVPVPPGFHGRHGRGWR